MERAHAHRIRALLEMEGVKFKPTVRTAHMSIPLHLRSMHMAPNGHCVVTRVHTRHILVITGALLQAKNLYITIISSCS
jgi:hypothetical protein